MRKIFKSIVLTGLSMMLLSCSDAIGERSNLIDGDTLVGEKPTLSFDFNSHDGEYIKNAANGKNYHIENLFNKENKDKLFKAPADPLFKTGVGKSGKSLYLDGHSTKMTFNTLSDPEDKLSISCWIAPRGFENVFDYGPIQIPTAYGLGHTRLTSILNKGDIEMGQGFLFGYGRLGKWGLQLCVENFDTGDNMMFGFYDPLNTLELYKWNHIAASYDGETGYICLYFNGELAYEDYVPELVNTRIIPSGEDMYLGYYCNPMIEFGCDRQLPSGLIDNFKYFEKSISPGQIKEEYKKGMRNEAHPVLDFDDVKEDRKQYEGDRYRPIYHGIPSAVWMNEPHAPIYYKGMYHLFYQHNPVGPYWSQIRWAHMASKDMIHWESVKDAVAPTPFICPEGVWTGGSVIGPDGTPWLAITAGTNTTTWTGQNIAFAHCKDPNDPYLTDWVVEDSVTITQPADDSMGEREQFRDPFVWHDNGTYYMLVSTSVPGAGGSANVFTSKNMRDWDHHGYLFTPDINLYPEQGAHWECVVMFPISTKDGKIKKWILFDCPQYTVDGFVVDCLYWVGNFDKNNCRFTPDAGFERPRKFDLGNGIYTGQTGFCYLTEEDIANGKVRYEDGRTVIISLAQGKSAGTAQNITAGWAHNLAMPVEIHLDDDGHTVLREPIKELASAYKENVFASEEGETFSSEEMNEKIKNVRGDALEIKFKANLNPAGSYKSGLYVRYNKHTVGMTTERTGVTFENDRVYVNRALSTTLSYVDRTDTNSYDTNARELDVTILLDRSLLEVYINNKATITTRIYPYYGDSDYLSFFDEGGNMEISDLTIKRFGSVYFDKTTPAYYGNNGNLGDVKE